VKRDRVDRALRTLASELRAAEDDLADDEHELAKWGFARKPSEIRRLEERIADGRVRLERCRRAASVLDDLAQTAKGCAG
jgi:hypothetical protein